MFRRNSSFNIYFFFASFFVLSVSKIWRRSLMLDDNGDFWTHWNVQKDVIRFKVEVQTKGYVQFGVSDTVKLDDSDIVTGWIKDGNIYFQDRHFEDDGSLPIDEKQDWKLISGHENDTHTVLEFQRKLNSCDDDDDIDIDENSMHLMYAFSDDDPVSPEEISHHSGMSGSRRVRLLEPPWREVPTENLLYWDFCSKNITVTAKEHSVYWCSIQKGPELLKKHHIIKFLPVIQSGHESYVHHMLLYACDRNDMKKLENIPRFGVCSEINMDQAKYSCDYLIYAMAVGTEGLVLPENVGIALEEKPADYYILEVHYTLQPHQKITDNSGIRIYYTPNLRKYDAGLLEIGAMVSGRMFIPPGQPSYIVSAHAHPKCLDPGMKEGRIKLFGAILHAHLLARGIKVRHFRGDAELPPIIENKNYDFQHQDYVMFEDVEVMKGDHLILECNYDSSGQNGTTYGGTTTDDEMCMSTFWYYPEMERYYSYSAATVPLVKGLLDVDIHDYTDMDYAVNFRELDQVDWSNVNISVVQDALRYSLHDVMCKEKGGQRILIKEKISYPARLKPFVKADTC